MADADTGEFWGLFGGFAPLPRKSAAEDANNISDVPTRLFGYKILLLLILFLRCSHALYSHISNLLIDLYIL